LLEGGSVGLVEVVDRRGPEERSERSLLLQLEFLLLLQQVLIEGAPSSPLRHVPEGEGEGAEEETEEGAGQQHGQGREWRDFPDRAPGPGPALTHSFDLRLPGHWYFGCLRF
jgi:hypothetical protein